MSPNLTFYGYSLLWLAEGQPQSHGDPRLQTWARVLLGAMLIVPIVFLAFIIRLLGKEKGKSFIAEPVAPNGGPAAPRGSLGVTEEPPSVS